MVRSIATLLAWGLAVYAVAGAAFAVAFVLRGVNRIDEVAGESGWGFRLVIVPGSIAFWPLLLARWIGGRGAPAERTAHRDAVGPAS